MILSGEAWRTPGGPRREALLLLCGQAVQGLAQACQLLPVLQVLV